MSRLSRAYEAFHGVPPTRLRVIKIRLPKRAWVMGRMPRLDYIPSRGKHVGVQFYHRFGDHGEWFDENAKLPLLAASEDGNILIIIKDGAKFKITNRGIIG